MRVYQTKAGIVIEHASQFFKLGYLNWDTLINRDDLYPFLKRALPVLPKCSSPFEAGNLLAPIGSQEIWAAGVTYLRSMEARMKEAEEAGGGTFYDLVYHADRPEIFFKATANRTVGHLDQVQIREDSTWNVPEPELTLYMNSNEKIVGYTIGNDMSSRSIEGENPLYLPQAKTYDGSASIGPCLYVPENPIPASTVIEMQILRNKALVYSDHVEISRMKRSFKELAHYLFRACTFPHGAYLMTGTCLVPPDNFTLEKNDEIRITIDHIGTLINFVK